MTLDSQDSAQVALRVRCVTKTYRRMGMPFDAVSRVSLEMRTGQCVALIGESGSGKTTLGRIITGLLTPTDGSIEWNRREGDRRAKRQPTAQMIFQNPKDSFNPAISVQRSVAEPIRGLPKRERYSKLAEIFDRVGIAWSRRSERPSAFSGGQLQRLTIARALIAGPELIVCDEPTSALDVSIQSQILLLLRDLQHEYGFSSLFITHDVAVAKYMGDVIGIMRNGSLLEIADGRTFFEQGPTSEYARSIVRASR